MRNNVRSVFSFLCVAGLAFVSVSCQPKIVQRRNVVAMIDYSGTIKPETLNIYATTISDNVFMKLSEADRWMLFPIDEGSKIKADHLLEDDMSQKGFEKGVTSVTHRDEEIRKKVTEFETQSRDTVFNTVVNQKDVRKQYTNMTDILGALDQISSSLIYDEPVSGPTQFWDAVAGNAEIKTENIIIIFSDMIQESNDLNFQRVALDESSVNKLIEDLKAKKKIPELKDAKVFICGRTGKDNKMIDGVKNFWTKFFIEAHADLKIYDYDSGNAIRDYMQKR